MEPGKGEITLLLGRWKDGEPDAFDELMPLVYPHLREVAAAYVRRERNPDVIQATALVHELYLRLLNQKKAGWEDRRHFYTFSAKVMRMILIDHARQGQAQMRGGDLQRVPLSDDLPWINIGSAQLLECIDSFLERRCALAPVQKVKVNRVNAQALKTALACFWQFCPRSVMRIHLCNNEHAIALTFDCVGYNFLSAAFAVHLRGIDQRHAEVETELERGDLGGELAAPFAHAPCALAEHRHRPPGGKRQ